MYMVDLNKRIFYGQRKCKKNNWKIEQVTEDMKLDADKSKYKCVKQVKLKLVSVWGDQVEIWHLNLSKWERMKSDKISWKHSIPWMKSFKPPF